MYLYTLHYMFNYSSYIIIINMNIMLNAIVTRMNKYIILLPITYLCISFLCDANLHCHDNTSSVQRHNYTLS